MARAGARLERIAGLIDRSELDGIMSEVRATRTGRPGRPPLVMLKALLLAQRYGLSDPELEDALCDRLSFRRFVGLPLDGGVPDETTLCRFRNELGRRGLTERLLAAVDAQLSARGLVLKRGTLIDASLLEADADVRKGPDGRPVTVEREAGFAKRRGKAFFDFKAHLAVDEGSGLVRRARLTPANVNESAEADALPIGDAAAVYADKGYDSAARRAWLFGARRLRRDHAARPPAAAADRGGDRPATGRSCRSARRSGGSSARSSAATAGRGSAIAASPATPPISTCSASPSTCAGSPFPPADAQPRRRRRHTPRGHARHAYAPERTAAPREPSSPTSQQPSDQLSRRSLRVPPSPSPRGSAPARRAARRSACRPTARAAGRSGSGRGSPSRS